MILSLNITDSLSTAINLLGDYNDCNQNLYFLCKKLIAWMVRAN